MGTVYLAKDLRLSTPVALKESIFRDEGVLKAFEHEARLLAGLRHPALPKVFDHFAEGAGNFLVMEYIAGNDLNEILEKRRKKLEPLGVAKPFEIEEVINWAAQLLDALDYLHSRPSPILHRDIKPQNLKLAERNQIILLDFGLAKGALLHATQALPQQSVRGYTPSYAPIEQIQGAGTDPRSDLYSLAATLYHLLTGLEPPDALRRANAILGGEADLLRPAHEVNPQCPLAISSVLAKTLALHCNARPATAKEMLRLLREAQGSTISRHGNAEAARQTVVSPPLHQTMPVFPNQPLDPQQVNYPASSRGETMPQTAAGMTHHMQNGETHVMQSKRNRAKIWLGVVISLIALASIGLAAVYFVTRNKRPLPPPVNQNRQVTLPPVKNSNTQNSNSTVVAPVIPEAAKSVLGADHFVTIKAGEFVMGTEEHGETNDVPHTVKITRPFEMGKYEITQSQWEALMGTNPSYFKGPNLPVENVSWEDVQAFITKLNELNDGYNYRLPTEAEWEYACRAGSKAKYESNLETVAWYGDNSGLKQLNSEDLWTNNRQNYNKLLIENGGQTHRVGAKRPNAWGLYDMQGNVWEWCQDWYGENYYSESSVNDPTGPSSGTQRINRGGSWYSQTGRCQTTIRGKDSPETKLYNLGFRLVRVKSSKP